MSIVYFVQAKQGGPIKIGTTRNGLQRRLHIMQANCPVALRVLRTVPGGLDLEQQLHRLLNDHRLHGEWFTDCPSVRDAMDDPHAFVEREHASTPAGTIGERIRRARLARAMSQTDLALEIGSDSSQVTKWEADMHVPRVSTLFAIADALGVPATRLLSDRVAA